VVKTTNAYSNFGVAQEQLKDNLTEQQHVIFSGSNEIEQPSRDSQHDNKSQPTPIIL